jgi:site-specific recombinase XerD
VDRATVYGTVGPGFESLQARPDERTHQVWWVFSFSTKLDPEHPFCYAQVDKLESENLMTDVEQLSLFDDGSLKRTTRIDKAIAPFLDYLRSEGKTENTIKSFRSDMNLVAEYLGRDTPLYIISTDRLNQFLQWLEFGRGVPCSRKSYARRVTTLKVFFGWLLATKILPHDPALKLVQRSGPAPLQQVLNELEIQQILDTGNAFRSAKKPDTRPILLFRLLLETGIKKSETTSLTRDSIEQRDSNRPVLMVRYKRQNVFKERRLSVSSTWLELMDEYLLQYQLKDARIFDCTARNLEYVLNDLGTAAGVETRVSFEVMRWTMGVRDYMAGMDMDALREKMGLSEISWRETSQKIMKLASDLREAQP